MLNGVPGWPEVYRVVMPIDSTTCLCHDLFGAVCIAWCYHGLVSSFNISSTIPHMDWEFQVLSVLLGLTSSAAK